MATGASLVLLDGALASLSGSGFECQSGSDVSTIMMAVFFFAHERCGDPEQGGACG